jgi:hypothetical protein
MGNDVFWRVEVFQLHVIHALFRHCGLSLKRDQENTALR